MYTMISSCVIVVVVVDCGRAATTVEEMSIETRMAVRMIGYSDYGIGFYLSSYTQCQVSSKSQFGHSWDVTPLKEVQKEV